MAWQRLGTWGAAVAVAHVVLSLGDCRDATAQVPPQEYRAADAVNPGGMDTHLWRPAVDSKGFFTQNGTDILGADAISLGLVIDYGYGILRTRASGVPQVVDAAGTGTVACDDGLCPPDGNSNIVGNFNGDPASKTHGANALVEHSFQGTLGFNYGLFNWAVVGVSLPIVLMNGSDAYNIANADNTAAYNTTTLNEQGVSSINFHGKLRLTRVDQGVGLAILAQVGIPVGSTTQNLGADPGFWYWPQALIEHRFGSAKRFRVGANVGFRGHAGGDAGFGQILLQDGVTVAPVLAEGVVRHGNLVTYGAALSYRILDPLDLVAEHYGTYNLASNIDSKQALSGEFTGGIKLFVERNSFLMLGGGSRAFFTGYQAADARAFVGFLYEPSIGDRDGDGYKDDQDECPDDPEDFDGFQDADGCPDPDNDNDGILDVDDRCPDVPEDRDGDQDDDGCPEATDGDRDGDGILDSRDKCPDDPEDRDGFEDTDGCPDPDNDKDGILDVDDECPLDPEDKDGWEDEDGCPDPDNDKDQILDLDDKCPNDPETYNGFEDEDGCPDKGKVIIEGNEILILEKVQFATGSAEILPESFPIIEAVATTLTHHEEFSVVEVAGHADERSSDTYNLQLTKARAASVVRALAERGVKGSRLVSQGYGEYCPLDEGHNPAAWEKNRRVEFKVVKTEDGTTGVQRGCPNARTNGVYPPPVRGE